MAKYLDTLTQSAHKTESIVCMGLDPVLEAMPPFGTFEDKTKTFFEKIFDQMIIQRVAPGAFKLNAGFYEVHDRPLEGNFEGSQTMAQIVKWIREEFKGIPVILDYKRGDIGKSSMNYAVVGFGNWGADAVTVAPYMGRDSIMPFVEVARPANDLTNQGLGVYVLNLTSNKGSEDIQQRNTEQGWMGRRVYHLTTELIMSIAQTEQGIGAVVGATQKDLSELAEIYAKAKIPLLIPGIGDQGGSAKDIAQKLRDANYPLELARLNSSSGLTHPWKKATNAPRDWAKQVVENLYTLNTEIGYKSPIPREIPPDVF